MKISIITVCYNSEKTISRTIESILRQKNVNLEYLVIDGDSNDNTLQIVNNYSKHFEQQGIDFIIKSEKDNGIYDAMNKGILLSTGDIIGILNSDDYYATDDVLSSVTDCFIKNNTDSVYGNLLYIKDGKNYRYWKSGKQQTFRYGWMPPHPAFFVKKSIYDKYGLFRLDCGINSDYEILLRFFEVNKISSTWLNKICTYMEAGGTSNNGIHSRVAGINNDILAWKKNNIRPNIFTILLKKIRKIPQFFLAKLSLIS